jgi:hypothetical protein
MRLLAEPPPPPPNPPKPPLVEVDWPNLLELKLPTGEPKFTLLNKF